MERRHQARHFFRFLKRLRKYVCEPDGTDELATGYWDANGGRVPPSCATSASRLTRRSSDYRRLASQVMDDLMSEGIGKLVAELTLEKLGLHPPDEPES
jgi:hypothetical protein